MAGREHAVTGPVYELLVLNESRSAYVVSDFKPGQIKFCWANQAALQEVFHRSLDELLDVDLNSAQSRGVPENASIIHEKVQIAGDTHEDVETLYFGGKAAIFRSYSRPIRCAFEGADADRTYVLTEYAPLADEQKRWQLSAELLGRTDSWMTAFDVGTEKVVFQNSTAAEFYGEQFEQSSTLKDWFATCAFEDNVELVSLWEKIMIAKMGDAPLEFSCRKQGNQDTAIVDTWHQCTVAHITDPSSGRPCILVQEKDVSALTDAQHALSEARAFQQNFFISMSHELRSPLHGVIGLCNILLDDPHAHMRDHEKVVRLIQTSSERMLGLINDILDAGSAKHGSLVVRDGVVDVASVVETVCEVQQPMRQPKVLLESRVDAGVLPKGRGDATRTNQIVSNLVSNALKFTHKGSVTVDAHLDAASNMIVVEVVDSGCGIPASRLPDIWEAFEIGDEADSKKYSGAGLGLCLVKKLVEAQGGAVGVESQHRKGSRFWFTLPVTDEVDGDTCSDSPAGPTSLEGISEMSLASVSRAANLYSETTAREGRDVAGLKKTVAELQARLEEEGKKVAAAEGASRVAVQRAGAEARRVKEVEEECEAAKKRVAELEELHSAQLEEAEKLWDELLASKERVGALLAMRARSEGSCANLDELVGSSVSTVRASSETSERGSPIHEDATTPKRSPANAAWQGVTAGIAGSLERRRWWMTRGPGSGSRKISVPSPGVRSPVDRCRSLPAKPLTGGRGPEVKGKGGAGERSETLSAVSSMLGALPDKLEGAEGDGFLFCEGFNSGSRGGCDSVSSRTSAQLTSAPPRAGSEEWQRGGCRGKETGALRSQLARMYSGSGARPGAAQHAPLRVGVQQ